MGGPCEHHIGLTAPAVPIEDPWLVCRLALLGLMAFPFKGAMANVIPDCCGYVIASRIGVIEREATPCSSVAPPTILPTFVRHSFFPP